MKPKYRLAKELHRDDLVMLDKNENPCGLSPKVEEALTASIRLSNPYPDSTLVELREVIAALYGLGSQNVLPADGSSELIEMLSKAFVRPGDEVITADFTFFLFAQGVRLMGGKPVLIGLKDWKFDLPAIAAAITPKTKLIFICNPNNPTGTMVTAAELDAFLAQVPENVIVVLDEAYAEFVNNPDFPDSVSLIRRYPNVLVLRTFSKAYGLAGLRVGYALAGEDLINCLRRVVTLFSVNALSQIAAVAAVGDQDFVHKSREYVRVEREYMVQELTKLGLTCVPSETIFVLVDLHRPVARLAAYLEASGIYTNIYPPFPNLIRFSVGSRKETERLVEVLRQQPE